MEISNIFSTSSQDESLFICLLLSDVSVQAFLVDSALGSPQISSRSQQFHYLNIDQAIIKIDEALQELGPESESVNEVAFGFEDAWMSSGDLRSEKKPLLQRIAADLSLQPIGFVVLSEAIIEQQLGQDMFYSGFIFCFGQAGITASLLLKGQLQGTEYIGLSGDVLSDVSEGFARFAQAVSEDQYFPQKIVLTSFSYDQESLLEIEQSIIEYDWASEPHFMQSPTIQVLSNEMMTESVIFQLSKAVVAAKGFEGQGTGKPSTAQNLTKQDTFGFQEILPQQVDTTHHLDESVDSTATSFGIPVSQDMLDTQSHQSNSASENIGTISDKQAVIQTPSRSKKTFFSTLFKKKRSEPQPSSSKQRSLTLKQSISLGVIAGIIAVMLGGYLYLIKTTVVTAHLKVKQEPISKEVAITLDSSGAESNPEKLTLAADVIKKQLTQTDFVQTTGVALDGEKAQGSVVLFNKTTSLKKFSAGTKLSSGSVVFTLDNEVSIASASVTQKDGGEEKEYGKTSVSVTAEDIGADGNIAKDSSLTVESFAVSSFEAKAEDTFSGGSSREYQTISQEDKTTVMKNVMQLLSNEAKTMFNSETKNGTYYIPLDTIEILSEEYDGVVGDEADILELKVKAEVSALAYNTKDLRPLAHAVLGASIPEGFELGEREPEILSLPKESSESATKSSTSQQIVATISSLTKPIIDVDQLYADVGAMSLDQATETLESNEHITAVEFVFSPMIGKYVVKKTPSSREKMLFSVE